MQRPRGRTEPWSGPGISSMPSMSETVSDEERKSEGVGRVGHIGSYRL